MTSRMSPRSRPRTPAKACATAGCFNLQPCPLHTRKPWGNRTQNDVSGYEIQRLRRQVIERDGGVCTIRLPCCTTIATTADHIVGRAQGGRTIESNLRASCKPCNEARRRQQAREGRAG